MPIAQLNDQLCFALYSASNRLTSIYRPLLDPIDLTYTQFVVLMALWEEEGVTISCLAEKTGLSKATMTPLLKRLEQKNLIERQVLKDNERQKNIVLTEAGRELSLSSHDITQKAFCAAGISAEQAKELMTICQLIGK